jgi:hypothetical protein
MYTFSGFAVVAYVSQAALDSAVDQIWTVEWRNAITQGLVQSPDSSGCCNSPAVRAGEAVALFSDILARHGARAGVWTARDYPAHPLWRPILTKHRLAPSHPWHATRPLEIEHFDRGVQPELSKAAGVRKVTRRQAAHRRKASFGESATHGMHGNEILQSSARRMPCLRARLSGGLPSAWACGGRTTHWQTRDSRACEKEEGACARASL